MHDRHSALHRAGSRHADLDRSRGCSPAAADRSQGHHVYRHHGQSERMLRDCLTAMND